ncbi:hypothetical protein PENSPDRAFT_752984 [Peniophora sp. CONT]|nr:hypothetical protein PENSPDRAFT_752984 [Peniophora sp. CONT]
MSSRSPSPPGPATPESADCLDPATAAIEDIGQWYADVTQDDAQTQDQFWHPPPPKQNEHDLTMLSLHDLIQEHAYDNESSSSPASSAPPSHHLSPNNSNAMSPAPATGSTSTVTASNSRKRAASPARKRASTVDGSPVVSPPRNQCSALQLLTPNLPESGAKSRVETQIRVTLDLAQPTAPFARVGSWKWLRLPTGTATKKRTRKEGKIDPQPEDILQLSCDVTCASAPHARVVCCSSCQNRESKRVARKIAQRVRPQPAETSAPDAANSPFGIVQFNCAEVLDFATGSAVLPLRITCYCRHHRERRGFIVRFRVTDVNGRVVGEGASPPIMITDDHKSTGVKKDAEDEEPVPTATGGKRKAPSSDAGRAKRVKSESLSTPGDTRPTTPASSAASTFTPMTSTSPNASFAHMQNFAALLPPAPLTPPASASEGSMYNFGASPSTGSDIGGGLGALDVDPMSLELDLASAFPDASSFMPQTQGPFAGPSTSTGVQQPQPQPSFPLPYLFFNPTIPSQVQPTLPLPIPKIHRLIPAQGPTSGGVEVTCLGQGFAAGVPLEVVFGGVVASCTNRWSENTLVCVLPPRVASGVVKVWVKGFETQPEGTAEPEVLFTYTDESDRQLMELALQVVGLKMTGKIEDAKSVAMRIIEPGSGAGGAASGGTYGAGAKDVETLVLDTLAFLDTPSATSSGIPIAHALAHATGAGQSLLHLASFANLPTLVRALAQRGADVDARDANGCTPLHLAARADARLCAAALLAAGADAEIVDAWGKTAAEVADFDLAAAVDVSSAGVESNEEAEARDDESHWGDAEEDSADEHALVPRRRRRSRRSTTEPSPVLSSSEEERTPLPKKDKDEKTEHRDKSDKIEKVDAKQAATLLEALQRRLVPHWATQLPMIPMQLPMPLVFPAFLQQPDAMGMGRNVPANVRALLTPQEWRAAWEKWVVAVTATRSVGVEGDEPPPVYTPRADGEVGDVDEKGKAPLVVAPTVPAAVVEEVVGVEDVEERKEAESSSRAGRRAKAQQAKYDDRVDAREVDAYGYRPAARPAAQKEDRMLLLFWIPILIIALVWACVHATRLAANGVRGGLPLRALMRL